MAIPAYKKAIVGAEILVIFALLLVAMRMVMVHNSKTDLGNAATSPDGRWTARWETQSSDRFWGGKSFWGRLQIEDAGRRVSRRALTSTEAQAFHDGGAKIDWEDTSQSVTITSRGLLGEGRPKNQHFSYDVQKREWVISDVEEFKR